MKRRQFLGMFGAGVAGLAAAPVVAPLGESLWFVAWTESTVERLAPASVTLTDWARRMDPNGKVPAIVALLEQTNELLSDIDWRSS